MAETPEDLNLPNTVITRLIKEALPEGVNVGKDARLAIAKAASVFVLYATSCANNFTMQSKRKTISGQDVLEAMKEMEFERFVEPLKQCLEAFKKDQKQKKESSKKGKESGAAGDKVTEEEEIDEAEDEVEEIEEVEEEEDS